MVLSSLSVLRPAQRSGARRAGYQVKHTGVTRGAMLLYILYACHMRSVRGDTADCFGGTDIVKILSLPDHPH